MDDVQKGANNYPGHRCFTRDVAAHGAVGQTNEPRGPGLRQPRLLEQLSQLPGLHTCTIGQNVLWTQCPIDTGTASRYELSAFSFSLSLSEGMCFRLSMIDASVLTELDAFASFTMASSFGLSAAATVCFKSIRT